MIDISNGLTAYQSAITGGYSRNREKRALSANERHRLLSAILRSITAIDHLKSEACYVLSVTEDYDIIKTIPSGCDVLLTTLNEILATSLPVIGKEKEERNGNNA